MDEQPREVMIVEDEPRYRELLGEMASAAGFVARLAPSAERAIREFEADPAPVAILDLNLPGMQGLELLGKLRQRWPRTQVVILTGFGDLDAAREAIHLDVVDFLTKPCHLGELEQALARASQRYNQAPQPSKPALAGVEHATPEDAPDEATIAADATLADLERQHILATLKRLDNNRRATAKALGISERKLYYRLAEYGWNEDEEG